MLYTPVTMKPVYPTATLNSMLSALDAATARGNPGNLDFRPQSEVDNVDNAPLGALNPLYTMVARLDELDPTCEMAASRVVVEDRKPTANIGRTSLFREFDYRSATSAQIGAWWRELLILYEAARTAESQLYGSGGERLSEFKDVETTDGPIEMFLMAIGDIDNSWIRYPIDAPIRVDDIMSSIASRFASLIPSLDHYGFEKGFKMGDGVYGIGTMPGTTGEKLVTLPARSFDRLGRAPWRIALRNVRVRDRMRRQFESRYEAILVELPSANADQYVVLSEGDDYLLLPYFATAGAAWTGITDALDALEPLSTDTYSEEWHWTHQFRTMGELVNALFIDGMESIPENQGTAPLTVRVRNFSQAGDFVAACTAGASDTAWPEGDVVDTGDLWSINMLNSSPMITGSTDYMNQSRRVPFYEDGNGDAVTLDGYETSTLPNGLLHIASCADITALQMIRFIEWLKYAWSQTGSRLMDITGRARKQVPKGSSVNISGTSTLMADANMHSQVAGTRMALTPSFNRSRHELAAQQGPYVGSLASELQPIVIPNANNWGGIDITSTIDISIRGAKTNFANIPAIISGQMSTGRAGYWQEGGVMTSRGAGHIVADVYGLPTLEDGTPAHYGSNYEGNPMDEPANAQFWSAIARTGGAGQRVTYSFQNTHPVLGQMKGFFAVGGGDHEVGLTNPVPDIERYDRTTTSIASSTVTTASGVVTTAFPRVLYPNMSKKTGNDGRVINRELLKPRTLSYMQTFYNNAALQDANDLPHHHGWLWDPAYAQVVGNSWKRLCGTFDAGVPLKHPFFSGAVSVFSPFVTLAELNGKDYVSEHSGQTYVTRSVRLNPSGSFDSGEGLPLDAAGNTMSADTWAEDFAPLGINGLIVDVPLDNNGSLNSIEQGPFHPALVRPVTPPICQPSFMGNSAQRELIQAYFHGEDCALDNGYTGNRILGHNTPAFDSHFFAMPAWSHLFSLKSSMTQSPIMKIGAVGLGKTNGSGVAGVSSNYGLGLGSSPGSVIDTPSDAAGTHPPLLSVASLHAAWQGEKYELNLASQAREQLVSALTVDSQGLCKSGHRYRYADDCNHWLFSLAEGSSYDGKQLPAFGPARAGCTGEIVGHINGLSFLRTYDVHPDIWWAQSRAALDFTQVVNTMHSSATSLTHHPWFDSEVDFVQLPPGYDTNDGLQALENALPAPYLIRQRRAGDTPSPWVEGDTSGGRLVDVQYKSIDLAPAVDAVQRMIESEGEAFVKGLHSSEAFLKVQTYQ
jgi:hypothetical protein